MKKHRYLLAIMVAGSMCIGSNCFGQQNQCSPRWVWEWVNTPSASQMTIVSATPAPPYYTNQPITITASNPIFQDYQLVNWACPTTSGYFYLWFNAYVWILPDSVNLNNLWLCEGYSATQGSGCLVNLAPHQANGPIGSAQECPVPGLGTGWAIDDIWMASPHAPFNPNWGTATWNIPWSWSLSSAGAPTNQFTTVVQQAVPSNGGNTWGVSKNAQVEADITDGSNCQPYWVNETKVTVGFNSSIPPLDPELRKRYDEWAAAHEQLRQRVMRNRTLKQWGEQCRHSLAFYLEGLVEQGRCEASGLAALRPGKRPGPCSASRSSRTNGVRAGPMPKRSSTFSCKTGRGAGHIAWQRRGGEDDTLLLGRGPENGRRRVYRPLEVGGGPVRRRQPDERIIVTCKPSQHGRAQAMAAEVRARRDYLCPPGRGGGNLARGQELNNFDWRGRCIQLPLVGAVHASGAGTTRDALVICNSAVARLRG